MKKRNRNKLRIMTLNEARKQKLASQSQRLMEGILTYRDRTECPVTFGPDTLVAIQGDRILCVDDPSQDAVTLAHGVTSEMLSQIQRRVIIYRAEWSMTD